MMVKKCFIVSAFLGLFFSSCNKDDVITDNTSNTEENIAIDLNLASTLLDTNLPARNGAELIEFNGEYWFLGGAEAFSRPRRTYYNDIWKSSDGKNWQKVVDNAPWEERSDFNLFAYDNKLWLIGGDNNNKAGTTWYNDVWSSDDGITWTQVIQHGPWETRNSMSVTTHNNKMYLIGGHSLMSWHAYQDIWESSNGKDWVKVGSISDDLLGVTEARHGIAEHTVTKFNDEYYLIGGQLSSAFYAHRRVLKSKDMVNWEVALTPTPWENYSGNNLSFLRPFVYKGNLAFIINTGAIKVADTGNVLVDYVLARQFLYTSKDGITWEKEIELNKIKNSDGTKEHYIFNPRVLIINDQINLYASYEGSIANRVIDNKTHIYQFINN